MVRYGDWLLWQGGANKTHVAINRAWSHGRRRASNNGRLVAGRGKESEREKERKRFPGSEQSETEKGYFLVLHIGGPTRQPSIRSSESTRVLWSIALISTTSIQFAVPVVERHLVRLQLAANVIANHNYVFRLSISGHWTFSLQTIAAKESKSELRLVTRHREWFLHKICSKRSEFRQRKPLKKINRVTLGKIISLQKCDWYFDYKMIVFFEIFKESRRNYYRVGTFFCNWRLYML